VSGAEWYIRKNGVIHGPATTGDLRGLLQAGTITPAWEGAPSPDGPWNPLAACLDMAPVRPISELEPVRRSPTAERLIAEALGSAGPLTPAARAEFAAELESEADRTVDNKAMPASLIAAGLTLILLARFSIAFAAIAALIVGPIVYKVLAEILKEKSATQIRQFSDEMLVIQYNQAKADRRAAGTRSAIGWAVIAVVAVIVVIAWLAAVMPR
jgi:hypothetical protein